MHATFHRGAGRQRANKSRDVNNASQGVMMGCVGGAVRVDARPTGCVHVLLGAFGTGGARHFAIASWKCEGRWVGGDGVHSNANLTNHATSAAQDA